MRKFIFGFIFLIVGLSWFVFGLPQAHAAQNGTTLSATKTATGTWNRTFSWTIDKSVTPAVWDLFKGDDGTSDYTVAVTKDEGADESSVSGEVCVTNGGEVATEGLAITDVVQTKSGAGQYQDSISVPLDLSENSILDPGESHCYPYEIAIVPQDGVLYRNVAQVTIDNHSGWLPGGNHCDGPTPCPFGPDPKADFSFPEQPTTVNDTINVEDTNGDSWEFSDDDSKTYSRTFDCDADAGEHDNIATIVETDQSDAASVTVNCHDPQVSKTAVTSFDRTFDWDVIKTADQSSLVLEQGQAFDVNYTVTPSATPVDGNWKVTGTITVANNAPSGMDAEILSVTDLIDDTIEGDIDCGDDVEFPYMLAGQSDLVCTYEADLPDATDRTNVASATQQNYSYDSAGNKTESGTTTETGSADVSFEDVEPTLIDECAAISDDQKGPLGQRCAHNQTPAPFSYTMTVGPYDSCGPKTFINTATVTADDTGATTTDSWTVDINVPCILGCTLTIGYWKNHSGSQKGPQANMVSPNLPQCLGGLSGGVTGCIGGGAKSLPVTTALTAYQLLTMNYSGGAPSNGITKLYAQLLAAKLNIEAGASNTIPLVISAADSLLQTKNQADWKNMTKVQQAQVNSLMGLLDKYNNGLGGVPHCSE